MYTDLGNSMMTVTQIMGLKSALTFRLNRHFTPTYEINMLLLETLDGAIKQLF